MRPRRIQRVRICMIRGMESKSNIKITLGINADIYTVMQLRVEIIISLRDRSWEGILPY